MRPEQREQALIIAWVGALTAAILYFIQIQDEKLWTLIATW